MTHPTPPKDTIITDAGYLSVNPIVTSQRDNILRIVSGIKEPDIVGEEKKVYLLEDIVVLVPFKSNPQNTNYSVDNFLSQRIAHHLYPDNIPYIYESQTFGDEVYFVVERKPIVASHLKKMRSQYTPEKFQQTRSWNRQWYVSPTVVCDAGTDHYAQDHYNLVYKIFREIKINSGLYVNNFPINITFEDDNPIFLELIEADEVRNDFEKLKMFVDNPGRLSKDKNPGELLWYVNQLTSQQP
jgi:hypothetical protein